MASVHDDNCDYANEESISQIEYAEDTTYMRQILDMPAVEISISDECNYDDCEETHVIETKPILDEIHVGKSAGMEESWDENKVKLLLSTYLQNMDKFQNPKMKKKLLWKKIGEVVGKDPDSCDKKFRNLKHHYMTVLNKKKQLRMVRWPFFSYFEQINKKTGFTLSNRYRPIAEKPAWNTPQIIMLGNSSNMKTPIVLNSVTPINGNGIGTQHVCSDKTNGPLTTQQKKRKLQEFEKVSEELSNQQANIALKLDRLVEAVEESNNIQRERNNLFREYLAKINK